MPIFSDFFPIFLNFFRFFKGNMHRTKTEEIPQKFKFVSQALEKRTLEGLMVVQALSGRSNGQMLVVKVVDPRPRQREREREGGGVRSCGGVAGHWTPVATANCWRAAAGPRTFFFQVEEIFFKINTRRTFNFYEKFED